MPLVPALGVDQPAPSRAPQRRLDRHLSWMVSLYSVLAAGWFLVVVIGALGRPLNTGAERQWTFVFLGLAAVGALSNVVLRRAGYALFSVGVPLVGALLILLSGHLKAAVITAWLLALAAASGGYVLRRLGLTSAAGLEWAAVATPLGLAILAVIGLILSLVGLLRPRPVFVALVILTLIHARGLVDKTNGLRQRWRSPLLVSAAGVVPERNSLVLALGTSFLLALTWALAPEVQFDALNYQLAVPRIYVGLGRLVDLPYFFHSYFAHLVNMLFALGLALDGQAVAKLLTLSIGGVVAAGIYALGRRALGPRVGLWAACLFCSTPLVIWVASTAYVDLAATMFLLASVLALARWRDSEAVGWSAASGALLGAGLGTKLTAVVALPAFVALLVVTVWRAPDADARSRAKALSAYALGALLFAGPWYAVSYGLTGNPFFPMFNGVFKSPGWPPVNTRLNADLFGIGTSPGAILSLPFHLTFETHKFGETLAPGAMGLAVALLPLGVLLLASPGWFARASSGLALVGVAVWGLLFQYARYLVPVLPLIVVAVVTVLLGASDPWARRLNAALLGAVVLAQFMVTPLLFWNVPERFPIKRALGIETTEAFVSRALPGYAASRYINRVAGPGEWVIGVHFANVRFYLDPPLVSGETAGFLPFKDESSPRALAAAMSERGFRYLMVDTRMGAAADAFPFMRQEFLDCCAVPKFARNGVVVYRVGATSLKSWSTTAANLLHNPGFERSTATGEVEGWSTYGRPVVGGAESAPHGGAVAIGASPVDGLTQRVRIEAGALYVLTHVSRADPPRAYARLQINWLNERGEFVGTSIDVVPAGGGWTKHSMMATAPDGAATAVVYVSVHEGARVWFDDYALTRGP